MCLFCKSTFEASLALALLVQDLKTIAGKEEAQALAGKAPEPRSITIIFGDGKRTMVNRSKSGVFHSRPLRIYISSTYKDLQQAREIAQEVIRAFDHVPVVAEHSGASQGQPIGECKREILSCDLFIGIYAHRYGSIPKGYERSFTRIEYETAVKSGVPCLIFLLAEDAEWRITWTDEDRTMIREFRAMLAAEHYISWFRDLDKFGYQVIRALRRFEEDRTASCPASSPRQLIAQPHCG